MIRNRLVYEREPEPEVEFDDIDLNYDGEECENPYEGYSTYEVGISENVVKHVRVYAPNAETAGKYITDFVGLDNINMDDIDEYHKTITYTTEAPEEDADYTVPLGIDLED